MKNNDFEFISSKFNEENISAPEALSEKNILEKLENSEAPKNRIKFNSSESSGLKTIVALVACFAVAVLSVAGVNGYEKLKTPVPKAEPISSVDTINYGSEEKLNGITYFSSYDEINSFLDDISERKNNFCYADDMKSFEGADTPNNEIASMGIGDGEGYAETYRQVDAVDEADHIKTDGEYIYYVNFDDEILIYSAKDGNTELVSTIEPEKENEGDLVLEMFLYNDKLIVIGTKVLDNEYKMYLYEDNDTLIRIYDVSDRLAPKLISEYTQSGDYVSSRMIGEYFYLVTSFGNSYYYDEIKANADYDYVPYASNAQGELIKIPVEDICAVDGSANIEYSVVGAIDVNSPEQGTATKAVLGATDGIYCSEDNLYITGSIYDYEGPYYYNGSPNSKLQINKISFDKKGINLTATGCVSGYIDSQFSLDEKGGYLRIATTTYDKDWVSTNNLYILNEKLEKVGEITGFSEGEHIEAVRFIGDTAYVITYEQTDPLFIIDLSNPENPTITGEVEIDGFSTILVPVDDKTLLGFGKSTVETEIGIVTDGVKLALFNVSNNNKPKVLDEIEFHGAHSTVVYTHKSLVKSAEKGYFAIPIHFSDDDLFGNKIEKKYDSGAIVIRIKDNKIEIENFVTDYWSFACTYIDDYLYVLDNDGGIDSFYVK